MTKIAKRVLFGALLIAAVLGILAAEHVLGRSGGAWTGLVLACAFAALAPLAYWEWRGLSGAVGARALPASGLLLSAALAAMPWWWGRLLSAPADADLLPAALLVAVVGLAGAFAEQMFTRQTRGALLNVAVTVFGAVYLGGCAALVLWLRLRLGLPALVLFLAAVKGTDIGAYFTGTAIGKHKLIPWLSPGKSWEGLAGGLAAGALVAIACTAVYPVTALSPLAAGLFGLIVGAAGQFADLCESLLKRSADVKDSGQLVPEFGGLLDMLDSPLLAAPAAVIALPILAGG